MERLERTVSPVVSASYVSYTLPFYVIDGCGVPSQEAHTQNYKTRREGGSRIMVHVVHTSHGAPRTHSLTSRERVVHVVQVAFLCL